MESKGQSARENLKNNEEPWIEENSEAQSPEEESPGEETDNETVSETHLEELELEEKTNTSKRKIEGTANPFVNGLSVGVGIGSIATFVIMWVAIFFTPQLPEGATYESMLSIFVYPLIYLLAVGLITLTTGIVRQYFTPRPKA
jgi:hypothetical protein